MGRPLCGVLSAEGHMISAFVRDEAQSLEFMQLFGAPEQLIREYCKDHEVEIVENSIPPMNL